MDAGNMLKPALARGELHCVGATTLDEYRKYVEKDAALERRFQKVLVRRAARGGHHRHPPRPEGALRGPSRGGHHRPGHRGRGDAVPPLHHRPPAARTRPSTSSTRPRPGCAWRSTPSPRRWTGSTGASSSSRSSRRPSRRSPTRRRRSAWRTWRPSSKALEREYADLDEIWKAEKAAVQGEAAHQGGAGPRAHRAGGRPPRPGPGPHVGAPVREDPGAGEAARPPSARRGAGRDPPAPQQGHGGGDRRDRLQVDRHSRQQDAGGRAGQAAAHGGGARQARGRPGRGGDGRDRRDPPLPRRALGPEAAERVVPVPGSHRRRQDRAHARRWPSSCSTPRRRWCASTCPSSWRSTRWRG